MRGWIALVGVLVLSLSGLAEPIWDCEPLLDLFSTDFVSTTAWNVHALDPTGDRIGWLAGGDTLVVLDVATEDVRQIALPALMRPATEFMWSSDGRRAVISENVFLYLYEPDVWVVDIDSSLTGNCTNDLAFGSLFDDTDERWIDMLPTWRSGDVIAYLRPSGDDAYGPVDMRITSVETCGPVDERADPASSQLLWPLPERFPSAFHVVASPVWSPDGAHVAMSTQDPTPGSDTDGVWILDAATGDLVRFVSTSALAVGFPDWYDATYVVPLDLAWIDGGEHLLVFAEDISPQATWPRMNLYVIDLDGSVHAVFSYEAYADGSSFYTVGGDGHTGVFGVPLQAVVLREEGGFITLHQEIDQTREDAAIVTWRWHTMSDDGTELRGAGTLMATPMARGRGANIVYTSAQNTALVLNRYLVCFDLEDASAEPSQD